MSLVLQKNQWQFPTVWLIFATDDARLVPGGETTGIIAGNEVAGNGLGDETT